MHDKTYNHSEMIGASKALGRVIREIKAAWLEAFSVELVVGGSSPSARFDNLLEQLRGKWSGEKDRERLMEALDIDTRAQAYPPTLSLSWSQTIPWFETSMT